MGLQRKYRNFLKLGISFRTQLQYAALYQKEYLPAVEHSETMPLWVNLTASIISLLRIVRGHTGTNLILLTYTA